VHRIITTLKTCSYVIQNPLTMKYRLGIKLFELDCAVQNTAKLVEIAKPYLGQLLQSTNETANIAVLEDKKVIYLNTIESQEVLRTEIRPGTRTIPVELELCARLRKLLILIIL